MVSVLKAAMIQQHLFPLQTLTRFFPSPRIEIPLFLFIITMQLHAPLASLCLAGCVYDDKAKEDHNLYRRKGHNDCAGAEEDDRRHSQSSTKGSALV